MAALKIPPETYKRFSIYYKRLKSKGLADFVSWMVKFWEDTHNEGYDKGFADAEKSYTQEGVAVSEDVDAEILDVDRLREILLSVKGIGERRADEAIRKITGECNEENQ